MTAYIIANLILWLVATLVALRQAGKGDPTISTFDIVFGILMTIWSLLLLL